MIRKTSFFFAVVFAVANSAAMAEETGTGKPENSTNPPNSTTTNSTQSTATVDCSWIESWLGTCEDSSDTSSE